MRAKKKSIFFYKRNAYHKIPNGVHDMKEYSHKFKIKTDERLGGRQPLKLFPCTPEKVLRTCDEVHEKEGTNYKVIVMQYIKVS